MPVTELDGIKAAVSDEQLLGRALLDLIEVVARGVIVGRSVHDATIALDRLREKLERAKP